MRSAIAPVALLAAVLLGATFTSLSLSVLALAGAVGLVLFRSVRVEEVYRAIDWSVVVLVGGMLALGVAFRRVNLSDDVASWLQALSDGGMGSNALMALVLVASIALTQVLNHVATAVIMTPIAMDMAINMNLSTRPFLMAVV